MKIIPPIRGVDTFGSGAYGASRGTRTHKGIDLACVPDSMILAPVTGIVSKVGYPYGNDLRFRYVEITTKNDFKFRTFYIEPHGNLLGETVFKNDTIIGSSQQLGKRYPGITEHVHFEVKNENGEYIDPEEYL